MFCLEYIVVFHGEMSAECRLITHYNNRKNLIYKKTTEITRILLYNYTQPILMCNFVILLLSPRYVRKMFYIAYQIIFENILRTVVKVILNLRD